MCENPSNGFKVPTLLHVLVHWYKGHHCCLPDEKLPNNVHPQACEHVFCETSEIISSFTNEVDFELLEQYTRICRIQLQHLLSDVVTMYGQLLSIYLKALYGRMARDLERHS